MCTLHLPFITCMLSTLANDKVAPIKKWNTIHVKVICYMELMMAYVQLHYRIVLALNFVYFFAYRTHWGQYLPFSIGNAIRRFIATDPLMSFTIATNKRHSNTSISNIIWKDKGVLHSN